MSDTIAASDSSSLDPSATAPAPAGDAGPAPDPSPAPDPAPAPDDDAPFGRAPDGSPLAPFGLKADGTVRRSNGGRKGGAASKAESEAAEQRKRLASVTPRAPRGKPAAAIPAPEAMPTDYRALAVTLTGTFIGVGSMVFGDDWRPEDQSEVQSVNDAFADWLKAQQIQKIDPTYGLALVLGAYALKRAQKPTMRDKLARMYTWVRSKFARG